MNSKPSVFVFLAAALLLAMVLGLAPARPALADSGELTHAARYQPAADDADARLAENPELKVVALYAGQIAGRDRLAVNPELMAADLAVTADRDRLAVNPELMAAVSQASAAGERDELAVNPELRFVRTAAEVPMAQR